MVAIFGPVKWGKGKVTLNATICVELLFLAHYDPFNCDLLLILLN